MPGTMYVSSGGQTGSILTIVSSGTGTITVSNTTLGKSYSKSVTAGDSAVFKGLKTGTWTVTLTDGTQTSTKTIVITSDYSTNIAYFSASINITYPANSTCVVKNSSGATVANNTNTTSSARTWTVVVNAAGTYTIIATATDGSGKSAEKQTIIGSSGQTVNEELSYNLVLFDGVDNTSETGGWVLLTGSGLEFEIANGTIAITPNSGSSTRFIRTVNPINFTKYKTLYFDCVAPNENCPIRLYTRTDKPTDVSTYVASVMQPTTRKVVSIDLSAITTRNALYVALGARSLNDTTYFYNIYAEE